MKQIFEDVGSGRISVQSTPVPSTKAQSLLIQTSRTLISAGTERMLVDFGRASYLEKARQQPDKVRMVLDKVKTDGLMSTVDAVRAKLNDPLALGYSNVGRVLDVGSGVAGLSVGDRVLSNGSHAEVVCVGKNLCARIPDTVTDDQAVFGVVGSIALQGVRLAQPTLGECFVVVGLGLVGLMTVQLLRANGCRVLGTDFDDNKLELARSYGAEAINPSDEAEFFNRAKEFSRGRGVDGVIITASTASNDPMRQSAEISRKRGRIILIGVVGLELNRADFYEKELTFQVSCSYGPGRYDSLYEQGGQDYPVGFVRWTEQRNFEAVLDMLGSGALETDALVSSRHSIESAPDAYDCLLDDRGALGILLEYPNTRPAECLQDRTVELRGFDKNIQPDQACLGAIGAGNYAGRVLLPAMAKAGAELDTVVSSGGQSAAKIGRRLGFRIASTDVNSVFASERINTVIVGTQHDTHARFTIASIEAGKNVFVEKPLALNDAELQQIEAAYKQAIRRGGTPRIMVGFNRRFAPLMLAVKATVKKSGSPMTVVYTCNAGHIAADSWVHDASKGGGRIIGEACHFIDAARFLVGARITSFDVHGMRQPEGLPDNNDTVTISLQFEDGSIAAIHYLANGHQSFPKERIEVFQAGRIHVLDNFRSLKSFGGGPSKKLSKQDKGQDECCKRFVGSINNGSESPIPFDELTEVSRVTVEIAKRLAGGGAD